MMDPKASAKAKRSYSQQGRKSNPTPAAIAQKKKAAQAGSAEKVRRPHSHALPSNWDRYDDGEEEAESAVGARLTEGEIAPKSKGADFAYLIEQARSQQDELRAPSAQESPSFFDELTADFMQGASSIRTVRRKNLLSRCEDDNFVVDDDLTTSYEVPFLNLDLHVLAARLSKIKLSERLFIEEDLLPKDLRSDESIGRSSSFQSERLGVIDVGQNLHEPDSYRYSSPAKDVVQTEDHNISVFPNLNFPQRSPTQGNEQEIAGGTNPEKLYDRREAEESVANINKSSTLKVGKAEAELDLLLELFKETSLSGSIQDLLDKKPSSKISFDESLPQHWKSAARDPGYVNRKQPAEAELDMLLDSSKETCLFGSIQGSLLDKSYSSRSSNSDFLYPMHQQSSNRDQISLKNTVTTSIDVSIDDLLAETSPIPRMKRDTKAPSPQQLGSMLSHTNRPRLPHSGSSSIVDLLADTSASLGQKSSVAPDEAGSSKLGSNTMDDFDSWIDTL